jgi:hypothetical protein
MLHTAPSSGWELPDFSSRQEVHHRLVALFHGKQLRDLQVSASARFAARRFSHHVPECLLLVSTPAAVAEDMFPRVGCPASAAASAAFVLLSVAELFYVDSSGCMPALWSVEPGSQRLHASHRNGSLGPCLGLDSVAEVLAALVGLPLCLG